MRVRKKNEKIVDLFYQNSFYFKCITEAYSELCQISKMETFTTIVNGLKPLIYFAKNSILDVWQDSEYTTVLQVINITSIINTSQPSINL